MTESARLVTHGTANSQSINVDMRRLEPAAAVKVQLTSNYTRLHPVGVPAPPGMTGAAAASLDFPKTIASGAVLALIKAEADALVAAGAAVYV